MRPPRGDSILEVGVLIPTHQRAKLQGRVLASLVWRLVPAGLKWHLGFEPQPLPYQCALLEGAKMPNLSPSNPKMRLAVEAFNRLPLGVTKLAGPLLTRYLP